jgi:hypothetical protein
MKNSLRKIFDDQTKIIEARGKSKKQAPEKVVITTYYEIKFVKPKFRLGAVFDEIKQFNQDDFDAMSHRIKSFDAMSHRIKSLDCGINDSYAQMQSTIDKGLTGAQIMQNQRDWLRSIRVLPMPFPEEKEYKIKLNGYFTEPLAITQDAQSWFDLKSDPIADIFSMQAEIAKAIEKANPDPVQALLDENPDLAPFIALGFPEIITEHRELNEVIVNNSSIFFANFLERDKAKTRRKALSIELKDLIQEMQ